MLLVSTPIPSVRIFDTESGSDFVCPPIILSCHPINLCLHSAAVIKYVASVPWKSFGLDTGDDTIGLKLLYLFARTVVGADSTNLYYGVRRELGAKGRQLSNVRRRTFGQGH